MHIRFRMFVLFATAGLLLLVPLALWLLVTQPVLVDMKFVCELYANTEEQAETQLHSTAKPPAKTLTETHSGALSDAH